jgi:hypothetical protein
MTDERYDSAGDRYDPYERVAPDAYERPARAPYRPPRTPQRRTYKPPRPSTKSVTARVVTVASAAAIAIALALSWQMARGADPALGPKAQAAVTKKAQSTGTSQGDGSVSGYSNDGYSDDGYTYSDGSSSSSSGSYYVAPQTSAPAPVTSSAS